MTEKTIPLMRTYEVHGRTFAAVTLREPTGYDYWHLGPIAEWQPAGESLAIVTYHEKVKAYAERLIRLPEGDATATLAVMDLGDTLKVERAVKDFFAQARASSEPSTSSPGSPDSRSTESAD